ncbi:MAG: hypothetical protein M1827_003826 [Pycnora praestabilis]|nr:MAG: hypothetical protein M1827_003826 [Pycnora praestabilis]
MPIYYDTLNYQSTQDYFEDQYDSSMLYPIHGNFADGPPWTYNFPHDTSLASSTAACPRSYPDGFNTSSAGWVGPTSAAYPPSAYQLGPHKHQKFFRIPNQQCSQHRLIHDDGQERLSQTPVENDLGNDLGDELYQSHSPASSHSSMRSTRVDIRPHMCATPADAWDVQETAQLNDEETDGDGSVNEEPYAKLIFKALMSVPEHRMVLKDIYEWFEVNTDKAKNASSKGWQNSIRHNLSMNGAFKKVDQLPPCDESKKGFIWVLEPSAIQDGVKSTTRFRKVVPNKKSCRSDNPAPQRQRSGAKGGKAARKAAKFRRSARLEDPDQLQMMDSVNGCMKTVPRKSLHDSHKPVQLDVASNEGVVYADFSHAIMQPPQLIKHESYQYGFEDIAGCVGAYSTEPLFCDDSEAEERPISPEFPLDDSSVETFFNMSGPLEI